MTTRRIRSGARAVPWLAAGVALLAIAVRFSPAAAGALIHHRESILRGQWWRIVTGHFVHYSASHLVWNLAVFLPVAFWTERLAPVATRGLVAVAALIVGSGVLFLPGLDTYAGLSGIGAALVAFLALLEWGRAQHVPWVWAGVLILLGTKIILETVSAEATLASFNATDVRPVPLAHLLGAFVGVGACVIRSRFSRTSGVAASLPVNPPTPPADRTASDRGS